MLRVALRFAVVMVLVGTGCAHGVGGSVAAGAASSSVGGKPGGKAGPAGPQVTGVWDWVFRSNDDQGNLRVEQEEWHLVQRGSTIEGYYDRALTLLSLDDHLFRCNQQLGITKFTRVRVAGSVENGRVRVQELGFDARPGPCDDGTRSLNNYVGELRDSTLRLEWSDRLGEQTLYKRQRAGGPRLAEQVGLEERPPPDLGESAAGTSGSGGGGSEPFRHPGVPIHGVFRWELRSVDAEGDARLEREEWHVDETDGALGGYYVRTVKRTREGAPYKCGGNSYETEVRFELSGHRTGDVVVLTETAYKVAPSPCDNGLRRLDTYQGSISDTGNELVLSFGGGNQVLRRVMGAPSAAPSAGR